MGEIVNIDQRPDREVLSCASRVELDGKRPILKPLDLARWYAGLSRVVGKIISIRIYVRRRRRSLKQNAYLWGGVYPTLFEGVKAQAEEQGMSNPYADVDDFHEWAKWKFLRVKRVLPGGEEEEFTLSSAKLEMEQFGEYIERLCAWGADRGIYVPRPDEWYASQAA